MGSISRAKMSWGKAIARLTATTTVGIPLLIRQEQIELKQ